MEASYVTSAKKPSQLPPPAQPEVAFIGRSNSGKSSLINALLKRKKLARTGQTPGHTQMANYFRLKDEMMIVDLPGYGYSATGRQAREGWEDLIAAYIDRPNIKNFIFLMDLRRDLTSEDDLIIRYLAKRGDVVVALTKADKASRQERSRRIAAISAQLTGRRLKAAAIFATSTLDHSGIEELRRLIFRETSLT